MPRNLACVIRFVELLFSEPDRKSPGWADGLRLHQGDHGGAVNSPGKKGAERYVRDEMIGHDPPEQCVECIFDIGLRAVVRIHLSFGRNLAKIPPASRLHSAISFNAEQMPRSELLDAAEDRHRARNASVA